MMTNSGIALIFYSVKALIPFILLFARDFVVCYCSMWHDIECHVIFIFLTILWYVYLR